MRPANSGCPLYGHPPRAESLAPASGRCETLLKLREINDRERRRVPAPTDESHAALERFDTSPSAIDVT